MTPDLDELLGLATLAAQAAGAFLLEGLHRARTSVGTKSSGTDMVSEMDLASEALIARTVLSARPYDAFVAEEGTSVGPSSGGVRWVVDPLDGTTNYLYGFPSWSVSIAAELEGRTLVGVVHDPTHGETFAAALGRGATCNDRPLRVAGAETLATALVATGFGYDAATRGHQAAQLACVLPSVRDVRRAGAASLDLCWVALGRLDAYYERGLQPWDWAAGCLVAAEAGATVASLADGTLVAAAAQLHGPLVALLESCRPGGS